MDRRGFLRALAAAGGVAVAGKYLALSDDALAAVSPAELEETQPIVVEIGRYESTRFVETFDPQREYGMAVPYLGNVSDADYAFIRRVLLDSARETLPPGAPYELRRAVPDNYGRSHRFAWYYNPYIKHDPSFRACSLSEAQFDPERGYYLLERGRIV